MSQGMIAMMSKTIQVTIQLQILSLIQDLNTPFHETEIRKMVQKLKNW